MREEYYVMVWLRNPFQGEYSSKLGYKVMFMEGSQDEVEWWWKALWKLKAPHRSKVHMLLVLGNKPSTREVIQKRCRYGLG